MEGQLAQPVVLGPVTNAEAIKEWKKKDVLARRILLSTISPSLQTTLVGCKTAREIWQRLAAQHLKCAANNRHEIQRKFINYEYQQNISRIKQVRQLHLLT